MHKGNLCNSEVSLLKSPHILRLFHATGSRVAKHRLLAVSLWIVERASKYVICDRPSRGGVGEEAGKEGGTAFSSVTDAFRTPCENPLKIN